MIKFSRISNCMIAQCDTCLDIVEFEDLTKDDHEGYRKAKQSIDMDRWKTKRVDGKWVNICVDCAK